MANQRELALRGIVALTPEEEEREREIERLPGVRDELLREIAKTKDPVKRQYLEEQLAFTPGDGGDETRLAEFDPTSSAPTLYSMKSKAAGSGNLIDVSSWEPVGGKSASGSGLIDVSSWEKLDYAPPAPEAETKRMGTADRIAHSFSKGAAGLVESVGWLTGLDSVENWGREQKERIQQTQLQDPELAAAFKKYEDSKGFVEAAKTMLTTPAVLSDFLVSSAAQMIPTVPVASIVGPLGRVAFNVAKGAGAADDVALAIGRATAEKWVARAGAAATEGVVEAGSAGADAEQFLISKGWDQARAKDAASEAALKVFAATTALSIFGTGRLEGDLATRHLTDKGAKGFAKNVGLSAGEESLQNTSVEQFTADAKQLADPTQQPDLGKAAATGLITGVGVSAPLHALGRMTAAPEPQPAPQPQPAQAPKPINPVNSDATLLALDKAKTVDEAIAVISSAASRPLEFERGVSIQDMEKDLAIRSVMQSKALQTFMEGLAPDGREGIASVLRMAASQGNEFGDGVRGKAIERAYTLLGKAGVLDAAEQERIAAKLEGTPADKQMIAEATALMGRDEWLAHREAQPDQLKSMMLAHEATVSNAQIPEAYRAEAAKVAMDYAKRSGIAKAIEEGTLPTGRTSTEPVARTMPPEQIIAATKLPVSHGRMTIVDAASLSKSAPTLFKKGKIGAGTARFLQVMGRAVGREVAFFKQDGHLVAVDGFASPDHPDTIFLNVESTGAAAMNVVLGHEFFHSMPEPIKAGFLNAIKPLIDPSKHEALSKYINQPSLDNAQVLEEVGADLFGNRFNEPEVIGKFLDGLEDKSLAQKIFEFVRNFIDKMIQAAKGAGNFKTDEFVTDLEAVRGAWVKAMQQYMGEASIGGKQAKEVSVESLAQLATVKGLAGDRARAEIARRQKSGEDPDVYDSLLKAAKATDPQAAMQLWLRDHRAGQLTEKKGETKANVKPEKVEPKIEVVQGSKTKDANVSKLKEELDRAMVKRKQDGERRSTYEDADATGRLEEAAGRRAEPKEIIAEREREMTEEDREAAAYFEANAKMKRGEALTPAELRLARGPVPEGARQRLETEPQARSKPQELATVRERARKYANTGVIFEVAPSPRSAIYEQWNELSQTHRLAISQRVAERIVPKLLDLAGVDGAMRSQWGGYLGKTNPSFLIEVGRDTPPGKIRLLTALIGRSLSQESMMMISQHSGIPGAEKTGLITVNLPDGTTASEISAIFKKIYEIEDGVLAGHTTIDGRMSILDFSGRSAELAKLVNEKLNDKYHVEVHETNAGFLSDKEYDDAINDPSTGDAAAGRPSVLQTSDSIRRQAEDLIGEEFTARGIEPIRFSTERGAADGDGRPPLDEGRAGQDRRGSAGTLEAYRKAPVHPEAVSVEGVHYSREQRPFLLSDKYGTGIKGAEYNRVMAAADKRLRKRVYFYVNEGQGVFPEEGVGAFAHRRLFDNLYDSKADPLGLASTDANAFESAVLDAGFDGYYSRNAFTRQGAIVLMGDHIVDVAPMDDKAERTAVGPAAKPNPLNDLKEELVTGNERLKPFAQVDEARIKQLAPELHERLTKTGVFDRLKPGEKYYKDEIAALIPRDAKLSTERGEDPKRPMSLEEFAKDIKDRVRAQIEYGRFLSKMHDWAFNVGDQLLSTQTGKVYRLTGRTFTRVGKLSANDWQPVYSYEAGVEGEEGWERGTFPEKRILESKTLKSLTTPTDKTKFSVARDPEFKQWFGKSVVADDEGNPLITYRGEHGDSDTALHSRLNSYTFGSSEAANTYAEQPNNRHDKPQRPRVIAAYLKIENPIFDNRNDPFVDLYVLADKLGEEEARRIAVKFSDSIYNTDNWNSNYSDDFDSVADLLEKKPEELRNLYFDAFRYLDDREEVELLKSRGYDGAIHLGNGETAVEEEYRIFDASQARSVYSGRAMLSVARNLGDLDAAQQAAAERVLGKPKTIKEQFEAFREDWKKNIIQGVFDQFAPLKELDPKAYILARMSRGGDSTLEALLMYGKVVVDQDGFYDVQYSQANGPAGFAQAMAKLNGEQDRFLLWIAAQRAEQLKAVGLENLFSEDDIRDLKTLSSGAMKDGTPRAALYAQGLADLQEFNNSVLKIASDSGLIDDQTRRMYENTPYVPFYRLQEEGITGFSLSPGLVNQTAWKKLKGGTAKLNADLMANMLQNWSHLITASAKNRAAKASLEAAVAQGVATEVPNGTPGKGLVSFRENGKERTFLVEDEHVMDAITSLEVASLGPWAKPFITMKRLLTVGVTASPTFKLRNLLRDSISAIGTSDLDYNPIANLSKGWKMTDKASEVRAKMLASGGMIRFGSMLDGNSAEHARRLIESGVNPDNLLDTRNKLEKFWRGYLHPAIEAYQELGDRGEQVNRAALYDRLIAKGMTHGEASFWARDLMDFSSSGKWAAVRMLSQTVPFMNARLQGMYKLGRAGKDDIQRLGTVLGAVSLASISLMLAYQDDEDFKKREDWDRQTYWWFKVGDTAFRIPKPFEIGAAGTIAEFGVELFASDEMNGQRFLRNLGQIVGNQLNMNPVPQLVKPLLDSYANQDSFTRRPIENLAQQRLQPEDRYGANTSEMARFLGSLGLPDPLMLAQGHYDPLSPVKMDHLVKGYFGWLGTMLTTALDYGIRPMVDRGEKPEMKLRDVFLIGNFVESLPSNSSRHLTVLYEQAREIEQAYGSYQKALKSGDIEAARELLKEEGDKIAKYKGVQKVKAEESRLNQLIQQTMNSKTLSAETKRKMIDKFSQQRDQLAASAGLR